LPCVEITTEQFLERLHGLNAIIFWNGNGKTWKNKPSTYADAKAKLTWRNELGDDIYFIVNAGGTKNADIVKINADYIYWDAGRVAEGHYLPLEVVEQRKKIFRERLAQFPLKPTFVVETRNGYQVYWLVTDCTKDQFVDIQRRLIAYFDSDKKVCNPNRVMRLPGYYWHKRSSGCSSFYVRVVQFNELRYTASTLLETLPRCPKLSKKTAAGRKSTPSTTKAITKDIHNIYLCNTGGTFSCFLTAGDALDYLKQQNLLKYLQIPAVATGGSSITVHCPFHTDRTASASVFRNQSTGHWLLTCHSDDCDFDTGSIIEIACRQLGNVDPATAARLLMKHYGLRLNRQEWINENGAILNQNIELVRNLRRDEYPHLYSVLSRIREDLVSKLRVAIDLMQKEPLSINFRPAFFFSLRGFAQRKKHLSFLPRYHNKQSKKIDRYCLLGLMQKLADDQIPQDLLDKARRIQEEHGHRYRVQFYAFPHYTPELFRTADTLAQTLKEQKVRLRGLSRGLIQDVFGPEAANRVYPLCRNQPCVESSTALAHQVLDAVWEGINRNGYTTLGLIAERVRQEDQSWAVTLERVSRLLPGLLSRGGLKEVYATKAMKEQYNIDSHGYPRIIVRVDVTAESESLKLPAKDLGVIPAA